MGESARQIADDEPVGSESLLSTGFEFEDKMIEMILYQVEKNIRNTCFAMQMANDHGFKLDDFDKLSSMFETFYEYVDSQMDTLTRLRGQLNEFSGLSLNKLRESEDFRRKPLPSEAFVSGEAYQNSLAQYAARQRK